MRTSSQQRNAVLLLTLIGLISLPLIGHSQKSTEVPSSYAPVRITEPFGSVMDRMSKAKAEVMDRQQALLANLMHNLKTERFFAPQMVNGRMTSADGPIKIFPLRGIKDSPTYLHDGRLLTLEDTVEFFNLVLETGLDESEKQDLVAFMRQL